jgi:hypothetical protein
MLLVATVLAALLAGGGVAVYLQLQSTKSAGLVKAARSSLFCAEAGLAAARPVIAASYLVWHDLLDGDPATDPDWYPITGDVDGDGTADYSVTIRDNDDERLPTPNDPSVDIDRRVFAVARCTRNADVAREVSALLTVSSARHVYRNQDGGGGFNNGNQNR